MPEGIREIGRLSFLKNEKTKETIEKWIALCNFGVRPPPPQKILPCFGLES